jgi:hypothetical protein
MLQVIRMNIFQIHKINVIFQFKQVIRVLLLKFYRLSRMMTDSVKQGGQQNRAQK